MHLLATSPRLLATVACSLLLAGGLMACTASSDDIAERASAISLVEHGEFGEILVDGQGNVLYMFEPDAAATVTCTFTCAQNWPPLEAVDGATPSAEDGVDAQLLGTLPNPSGGEVVTYNGWPLYRYAADKAPGEARGQDTNLNGGMWYVLTPEGKPLIP